MSVYTRLSDELLIIAIIFVVTGLIVAAEVLPIMYKVKTAIKQGRWIGS